MYGLEQPPRARGRPRGQFVGDRDPGATPAGAGTTQCGQDMSGVAGSNPRGRGDDVPFVRTKML